jgi:anaerobic magnesium-protoporphyrin IX monomethyl ester cyclase
MSYRVLFLNPPFLPVFRDDAAIRGGRNSQRARYPHLGLAYMAAVLRSQDQTYRIIDMNLGYSLSQVQALVRRDSPDFVCVTVYSAGYRDVYSLVDSLRPFVDGRIVLGGPHISITGADALEKTQADFAVIGEGEHTLAELVQGVNLEAIRGLVWRDGSRVRVNARRPYLTNLDSLPFPAFEDFELERYMCYSDKRLPIVTSRGCPFGCIYCCTRLSMGEGFRARSPENVLAELKHWYDRGWRKFDINDDVFTLDRERALSLCRLILKERLDIQFLLFVGIRVNSVDEELLRQLKLAGCRFISYGCESGSNRVLATIRKGISTDDVLQAVDLTRKVGISHKVNFIIGHPTERYEDALETMRFARRLRSSFVGFNNLIPYPGTDAYRMIETDASARFLFPPDVYLNELTHKKMLPVFETAAFSRAQRLKVLKKGFNLEERTLARFRFGRFAGYVVYLLGRNRFIAGLGKRVMYMFLSTRLGAAIHGRLHRPRW